ncbi:MAG: folylpolyglutamate synthase/dihydrofolate synthase family protein [Gemmatimonadota bacterium]
MRALLDAIGAPDRRCRIVQVAGTNGKGSTASFLAAGLRSAGLRVGLFTSPHLVDFRERVRVDGRPISEDEVVHGWHEVWPEVERRSMTFFEANTAIALAHFARSGVEVAVLETGLGGRLDSVTATEAELCVITRIAFDHREYLGETLAAIAGEKAAILRGGAPGFSAPQSPTAERVIRERAHAAGSRVTFVPRPADVEVAEAATALTWRGERVRLRMPGEHQAQNATLALETLSALLPDQPPARLVEAVAGVVVPGRFQTLAEGAGSLVLDVAHNPDAVASLARTLTQVFPRRPKRVLLAMLRDKDLAGSLAALRRVEGLQAPVLVGSAASAPRSRRLREADWSALAGADRSGAEWIGDADGGLRRLRAWLAGTPDGVAVLTGSFTSVGEAMRATGVDPVRA